MHFSTVVLDVAGVDAWQCLVVFDVWLGLMSWWKTSVFLVKKLMLLIVGLSRGRHLLPLLQRWTRREVNERRRPYLPRVTSLLICHQRSLRLRWTPQSCDHSRQVSWNTPREVPVSRRVGGGHTEWIGCDVEATTWCDVGSESVALSDKCYSFSFWYSDCIICQNHLITSDHTAWSAGHVASGHTCVFVCGFWLTGVPTADRWTSWWLGWAGSCDILEVSQSTQGRV